MNIDITRAIVDLDAIEENFRAVCRKAGVPVMAVVKADAYGHGVIPVARLLEPLCGFFGVSSMAEALQLRRAGLTKPILILGYTPPEAYPAAVREGIRPAIFHYDDALALSQAAKAAGVTAPFHFALDTGMSRIGFQPTQDAADLCARIAALPGLDPEGLFSHFATADCADLSRALEQRALYDRFDAMLKARGVSIRLRHLNNSAGLMNFHRTYDMVRSGIITYGMYPSDQVDPRLLPLRPALKWVSGVSHVKTLPAGREVSYGGTFVTTGDTVIATIPVGYADGYRRSLSGRFYVLINGRRAPILGRICMDQMMVDVTGIPGVAVGSPVTLIGADGGETISIEAISAQAGSFNYEFACGIGRRVPRVYMRHGSVVQTVQYLLDP